MGKQLARAFDGVVRSHYGFADASHLTAVEEDEAYDFIREARNAEKEAYHIINEHCLREPFRDSGLGSMTRSLPSEIPEKLGARSRILSTLQQMQLQEEEEGNRVAAKQQKIRDKR